MKTGDVIQLPMPAREAPTQEPPNPAGKLFVPQPGEPVPEGMVSAKDVLNGFSQRIASQAAIILNAGMPLHHMITLHIDHATSLLALYEADTQRAMEIERARRQLGDFTRKKVAQRRQADRATGSKGYRGP